MRTKHGGFTLLELVVTLIILGLLMATGLPAMSRMLQSSEVRTLTNELVRDLNVARSHASDLNQNITMCRYNNAGDGCRGAGNGEGWQNQGWLIFVDDDNDRVPDLQNQFIRITVPSTTAQITHLPVEGRVFAGAVNFFKDGTVRDSNSSTTNAIFIVCPANNSANGITAVKGRTVNIDERGNIRTSPLAADECSDDDEA